MRIIKPLVVIEDVIDTKAWAQKIEYFTRKCYKSEGKMTDDSYDAFVRKIFRTMKHEGVIEHRFCSVTFITDRGVSHEAVRHRMASYLQESTRYCDYNSKGVTFIQPPWVTPGGEQWNMFVRHCDDLERKYIYFRDLGWTPQQARYFLPNGIKTEFAATLNLGSWYNFFRKRTPTQAHPQMRQLAVPLLRYFQEHLPMIFDGIELPVLDFEEAKVVLHPGVDSVEPLFEEVPLTAEPQQYAECPTCKGRAHAIAVGRLCIPCASNPIVAPGASVLKLVTR